MDLEDGCAISGGCFVIFIWIVGVGLSLGVSAALIYFLYQAAQGNVF